MPIAFERIPGFEELFLTYINDYSRLSSFYNLNFKDPAAFEKAIVQKNYSYSIKRIEICDILTEQNKVFNSSSETFKNIDKLASDRTFAVVTGQQAGLFTGSLYTIFKAINTAQLAEELSRKYPDVNFVPVFWIEADDHDFLEVNNIHLFSKRYELKKYEFYPHGEKQEKYLKPVTDVILDDTIISLIESITNDLQQTDFSISLTEQMLKCYRPGVDMKTAFARFFNFLLGELGIILFDPTKGDVKQLIKPLFIKELESASETCEIVIKTSAALEREFEPQVKPRSVNLFMLNNGNRYGIDKTEDGMYSLRHSRQKYTKEEIIDIAENEPERFSGNVILRPVIQDYLLPSIAYIGGPSEISYFAQIKNVYEYYNVPMPVIYPRTSVTILEKRISAFLNKYDIDFLELFDEKKLAASLAKRLSETDIDLVFERYKDEFNALNYSFYNELQTLDSSLVNNFKNRAEKYSEAVEQVKKKFLDSQLKQNSAAIEKLSSIIEFVYPAGVLQERMLNVIYFVNKYGKDFIEQIKNQIEISGFNHQIVSAGSEVKAPLPETAAAE